MVEEKRGNEEEDPISFKNLDRYDRGVKVFEGRKEISVSEGEKTTTFYSNTISVSDGEKASTFNFNTDDYSVDVIEIHEKPPKKSEKNVFCFNLYDNSYKAVLRVCGISRVEDILKNFFKYELRRVLDVKEGYILHRIDETLSQVNKYGK